MARADWTSLLLMESQPASCTPKAHSTVILHVSVGTYIDLSVGKNIDKDAAEGL